LWVGPAALYVLTVALSARRLVADGYDGVGFVLAMQRLDLARFAPQPPGYPLFVALGRVLHGLGLPAAVAVALVSALLLGGGISAIAELLRRRVGRPAGALAAALLAFSPLCYALGIATLSDGAGVGALLLAVAVLGRGGVRADSVGGALLGAAMGIRPTYAPLGALVLLGLWLHRGGRAALRAGFGAVAAVVAWLVPFALIVGPRLLFALSRAHIQGHFTDFGGAMTAEPSAGIPLAPLLRGLADAALGPAWPLGALAVVAALVSLRGAPLLPPLRRAGAYVLLGLLGYLAFTLVALPVRGHARHLLPAVVALLCVVAGILGAACQSAPRGWQLALRGVCGLLVLAVALPSLRTLHAFRSPAPGPALAEYVASHYPPGTLLYGARAARFLDLVWGSGAARPTTQFGDVLIEAERLDRLPAEVLVTSEVKASTASLARLKPLARFCYPAALPAALRFDPYPDGCIELRSYRFR
jgi:hypothetical protein